MYRKKKVYRKEVIEKCSFLFQLIGREWQVRFCRFFRNVNSDCLVVSKHKEQPLHISDVVVNRKEECDMQENDESIVLVY